MTMNSDVDCSIGVLCYNIVFKINDAEFRARK